MPTSRSAATPSRSGSTRRSGRSSAVRPSAGPFRSRRSDPRRRGSRRPSGAPMQGREGRPMRLVPRSSFVLALGFGLAVALAPHGARAGDPARDLGDIEPTEAKDVDDANTAEAQDLDQVLGDGSEDAHIVDSNAPEGDAQS